MTARLFVTTALVLGASALVLAQGSLGQAQDKYGHGAGAEKVLYIWAQDQAHVAPDFLAVIDFDEASSKYGQVINVVPLPPPGNIGNEPHHCHLNSTKTILGCGGLLSPKAHRTQDDKRDDAYFVLIASHSASPPRRCDCS